jgi:hypothetical protein
MAVPIPATNVVTAVADALTAVANELAQRSELNNSPGMQAALVVQRLQAVLDAQRVSIADEDVKAIQLLVAAPDAAP